MSSRMGSSQGALTAEAAAEMSDQLTRNALQLREQAASIAHYKKMYDRSSEMAKIGVWECDLATGHLSWTDGVYDLFELPKGSPIDRATTLELYEEKSRREMEALRAEAIANGTGFTLDIQIRTAKGNPRWLRLTADVEQEDGRAVRIFGTKQDITQSKTAQEKVQSLQTELIHISRRSAMDAMAATLAHELNQPLSAISNYVAGTRRALSKPGQAGPVVASSLEAIEKCAFRAGDIIRSLRAMTNGSAARRVPVDPNDLIREAGALAMAGVPTRVSLRYDLAGDALVLVDPIQIQQVLINLIRNAAEAVQDSPRREILISTVADADKVTIRVDDSGHGIRPDLLGMLFEISVTSKPEGMGMGLSISRTIVEAHSGKISAANRDGGGASFCVTLPRTTMPLG